MAVQAPVTTTEKQLDILIVDNDERAARTLSLALGDHGHRVTTADDGTSALHLLAQGQFDLVLIDTMMPGMNGVEALRQIKRLSPRLVTAIMTGRSQLEGFVSDALWAGVDGILHKPVQVEAVLSLIERKCHALEDEACLTADSLIASPDALRLVPEEMARKYCLLPLTVEQGALRVAMADPGNLYAIEDLRIRTSLRIEPLRAPRADIESALTASYQSAVEIERQIERITPLNSDVEEEAAQRLSAELVSQAPVVRAVDLMLRRAVQDQASDIHLEPQEDYLRVRYRIDGVLHDGMRLPLRVHAPIISRIKVLANLNIAERRRPQDGQFSFSVDGTAVDLRVATINTIHGEMAVLRVLDKSISVRELDQIGFLPDMQSDYERLLRSPWGIILIAGPTGSGKTSTLYASINQLDRNENKIITIEDPVEYRFPEISQVQVNRQAGVTFANGLRSAMRLDPDVILVGEIRDQETANIAVQASLTGHLVLSSIHANDSVGAIFRLIDLGVEPFLITSALLGVLSQRLVRRVCEQCRERREVPLRERLAYAQQMGEELLETSYGTGCSRCADTGYRGRIAVFELLVLDDRLRRMVLQNANSDELRAAALESGMRPMLHDGMIKAKAGITTPTEVLKKVFAVS